MSERHELEAKYACAEHGVTACNVCHNPDRLPPEVEASLYELTMLDGGAENTEYIRAYIHAQAEEIERLREQVEAACASPAGCADRDLYKAMAEWLAEQVCLRCDNLEDMGTQGWLKAAEEATR